ncbi:MAG: ABC transporter substrate-binding protein [Thermoleophilia bacterium]|nr:ABC transporter substrate-binding protein [Thermoleophilia bacterium]
MRRPTLAALVLVALIAALAAGGAGAAPFGPVREEARGQTVDWWMYGGDARVNAYVDRVVVPAARRRGVTLRRVPVADTADAVQRVIAERRAGRDSGGAVDLIWINGENFAAGRELGLWRRDWARTLPNARFVDPADPSIARDLGVPTEGQESPWSRAAFVFAHDRRRTPRPPRTLAALLAYARANPGRVTYPAPPDFTGSAFVRQVVQRLGSRERAFAYLRELRPLQWRGGRVFPGSEAELNRLFADGQVDIAMSYDPSLVAGAVRRGQFPATARPFLIGGGALVNTSYVTIPANAGDPEGALVVADLLLDPVLQGIKADPRVLGLPSVLDPERLPPARRRALVAPRSPYLLRSLGRPLAELPAGEVGPIERAWQAEVLRSGG